MQRNREIYKDNESSRFLKRMQQSDSFQYICIAGKKQKKK